MNGVGQTDPKARVIVSYNVLFLSTIMPFCQQVITSTFLASIGIFLQAFSALGADSEAKDCFLREFPEACAKLEERFAQIHGSGRSFVELTPPNGLAESRSSTIRFFVSARLLVRNNGKSGAVEIGNGGHFTPQ